MGVNPRTQRAKELHAQMASAYWRMDADAERKDLSYTDRVTIIAEEFGRNREAVARILRTQGILAYTESASRHEAMAAAYRKLPKQMQYCERVTAVATQFDMRRDYVAVVLRDQGIRGGAPSGALRVQSAQEKRKRRQSWKAKNKEQGK